MNTNKALKIIKILADGIDPTTGEVFGESSPYQHPQIIRALFATISVMERQEERERKANRLPPNAGKPWTAEEEQEVLNLFRNSVPIPDIASRHNRTHGAIEARLAKNGLIDQRTRFMRADD